MRKLLIPFGALLTLLVLAVGVSPAAAGGLTQTTTFLYFHTVDVMGVTYATNGIPGAGTVTLSACIKDGANAPMASCASKRAGGRWVVQATEQCTGASCQAVLSKPGPSGSGWKAVFTPGKGSGYASSSVIANAP